MTNDIIKKVFPFQRQIDFDNSNEQTDACLQIWSEAIQQAFFSLSVGLCPIMILSSYNKFSHDMYRWVMWA